MKVKSESEVAQSCPTLSDPMDCSLPGSSVHGIFQARVLEWGAIAFSLTRRENSCHAPWPALGGEELKCMKGLGSLHTHKLFLFTRAGDSVAMRGWGHPPECGQHVCSPHPGLQAALVATLFLRTLHGALTPVLGWASQSFPNSCYLSVRVGSSSESLLFSI